MKRFFLLFLLFSFFLRAQGIHGSTGENGVNSSILINAVSYRVSTENMSRTNWLPVGAEGVNNYLLLFAGFLALVCLFFGLVFGKKRVLNAS